MFDVAPETQRQFDENEAEFRARTAAVDAELAATRRALTARAAANQASLRESAEELAEEIRAHAEARQPSTMDDEIPTRAEDYGEPDEEPLAALPRQSARRRPARPAPNDPADDEDLSELDWLE